MKFYTTMLILLSVSLLLSCGSKNENSKKAAEDAQKIETPPAEVPLSPGVIEASVDIMDVAKQENSTMITAKVIEVTGYGSSTEPVAPNTEIRFTLPEDLSNDQLTRFKKGATISAKLLKMQQGVSMNTNTTSTSDNKWTLISVNQ